MASPCLGIDFGTCYSSAAILRDGLPTPVKVGYALTAIPSAVSVRDDGTLLVGPAAEAAMSRWPDRYRRHIKPMLGERDPVYLGERPFLPEQLVAAVLTRLKTEAERRFQDGEPFTRAVLTVPADYEKHRRTLMEQAGARAGFTEVRLLEEPVAAAGYALWERRGKPEGWGEGDAVLVYDLGGGTFDAAILRMRRDGYESLAAPVSRRIGGGDFDQRIFAHLGATLPAGARALLRKRDDGGTLARLLFQEACRKLKVALSDETVAEEVLSLEGMHRLELTRETFEALIADPVEETVQACRDLLATAGVAADGLRGVILVGGSTLVPCVRREIVRALKCPAFQPEEPALAVALGAALHSAEPAAENEAPPPAPPPPPGSNRIYRPADNVFDPFQPSSP
jgi:molecular chaperone DnaK